MPRLVTTITILLLLVFDPPIINAATKHLFKIATLAPAGSVWVEQFERFAQEVEEKTGGEVGFRIYPGGVMGDDQAMLRKMRVGQLHGGGFTMTGVSTLVPDFRAMAIPFFFTSYEEVDHVRKGLLPSFRERFRDKGLELIAMTEVGFIYAMSTKTIRTIEDLQQSKNWSPAGDPVSEAFLTALGITPIQLAIPDVLSSLQSGLVETVYNSLYGAIVLQWFTKARYVVDVPYGYAYGAVALDAKKFSRLSAPQQQAIDVAAARHFPILLEKTRESNAESHRVMVERGTEFLKIDPQTVQLLEKKRDDAIKVLIPGSLPPEIFDQATELLREFRASHGEKNN